MQAEAGQADCVPSTRLRLLPSPDTPSKLALEERGRPVVAARVLMETPLSLTVLQAPVHWVAAEGAAPPLLAEVVVGAAVVRPPAPQARRGKVLLEAMA